MSSRPTLIQPIRVEMPREVLSLQGRGTLTGQTGTGKSTLARILLRSERRVLVADSKGEFEPIRGWQSVVITDNADKVSEYLKRSHVIVRPPPVFGKRGMAAWWDDVLGNAWYSNAGKCNPHTLYIDELTQVAPSWQVYPEFLGAYCRMGRSMDLKVLVASQRPTGCPIFVFSEASQHWMFRLLREDDLARVAEYVGAGAMRGTAEQHSFWYGRFGLQPKQYKLLLPTDKEE